MRTAVSDLQDSECRLAATRSVLDQAKRRLGDARRAGVTDRGALDLLVRNVRHWESAAGRAEDDVAYWECRNDR